MPGKDSMNSERPSRVERKFGPSDNPDLPGLNKELFPAREAAAKANAGSGTPPDWRDLKSFAEARPQGLGRQVAMRLARETAEEAMKQAMQDGNFTEADVIAKAIDTMQEQAGGLEVRLSQQQKEEIRGAMIDDVARLTDPEVAVRQPQNAFTNFNHEQTNRYAGLGKHFSPEDEREISIEFIARAELAVVQRFWDDISSKQSKEYDPFQEMSVSKIDSCPKISRNTYRWLASQKRNLSYITNERTRKEVRGGLTGEVDRSLAEIYNAIRNEDPTEATNATLAVDKKVKLNLWGLRGYDREKKIKGLATKAGVDDESVRLAWQIAMAECWSADQDFGLLSHPAFRLTHLDQWRATRYKLNMPVPGGARLAYEYFDDPKHAKTDDKTVLAGIFADEGTSLARVGFKTWSTPGAGEDAARSERYLVSLLKEIEGGRYIDLWLPQTAVMGTISNGAAVFKVIEEMGKIESAKLSAGSIAGLREKLVSVLVGLEDRTLEYGDKKKNINPLVGRMVDQWARSLIWVKSWANPETKMSNGADVVSGESMVAFFRELITLYDETTHTGEYIGYGRTPEEGRKAALDFLKWFDGTRGKVITYLEYEKKYRPNMLPKKKKEDLAGIKTFKADYWFNRGLVIGTPGLPIGRDDKRWWLRR